MTIPEGADRKLFEAFESERGLKELAPGVKLAPIVNALWMPTGKTADDMIAETLPEENPDQKFLDFVLKPRRIAQSKAMQDFNDGKIALQLAEQEYSEMKFDDATEEAEAKEKKMEEITALKESLPGLEAALTEFKGSFDPEPLAFVPWMNTLLALLDNGMTSFEVGGSFWPVTDQFALFGKYSDVFTEQEKLMGAFKKRADVERGEGSTTFFAKILPNIFREDGGSAEDIVAQVERSLANLGAESLDMVQLVWWDSEAFDPVPALKVLKGLKDEGKIKAIGVISFPAAAIKKAIYAGIPIACASMDISIVDQSNMATLALCKDEGVTVLATNSLLGGLLSDKFVGAPCPASVDPDVDSPTAALDTVEKYGGWPKFQKLLAGLQQIAAKHSCTMASVAMRWVMDAGATPVVGVHWDSAQFTQVGYPGHKALGPVVDKVLMWEATFLDQADKDILLEAC
mmetsp:Transcript_63569/g.201028  ORF Transcript_63569/g.201028 Transcript_63569/m.201028 type:complete len:458 (-) Transcript_63569:63-1436(-)